MVNYDHDFDTFERLFDPNRIAFIGASDNSKMGAMLYLKAFITSKWKERFYPVNPKRDKILIWKCYPSILDIPYPIDTAYISLKVGIIPNIVEECVEKGVKWVIIFASGFSETGNPEGLRLEKEIQEIIKGKGTRVIGPNCIGPYNSSTGMSFGFFSPVGIPGSISFFSQSGGHLGQLINTCYHRDVRLRHGISFGNQIDLNCTDFLNHFAKDPKTTIITGYLESFGSSSARDFYNELKTTTPKRPVIIWKGGNTTFGSRAAFSHTGAIASDSRLWNAMIKQTGAVMVKDNEEWWNAIKTFELMYPNYLPKGKNIGIITPGGGSSVNLTDIFASQSLNVPPISKTSQEEISKILPDVNVNITNPIDLGASGFIVDMYVKCLQIVVKDPNIDIIVIPLWRNQIFQYVFKRMLQIRDTTDKPFVFCLPSIADSLELAQKFDKVKKFLHKKRALYFLSLRDAAKSMRHLCEYAEFLRKKP